MHDSALNEAAAKIGSLGVITQYDPDGRSKHQVSAIRVGPLAVSKTMFFILDGDYIQGFVHLSEITTLKIENRRSFRHPILGIIAAIAMLFLSLFAFFGVFIGYGFFGVLGGVFLAGMGGYTLAEIVRNRQVPFLIISTPSGPRPFEIPGGVTLDVESLLTAMGTAIDLSSPLPRKGGFEVQPPSTDVRQ